MNGIFNRREIVYALRDPLAPVAQLDRALPSEGKGRAFESRRARHDFNDLTKRRLGRRSASSPARATSRLGSIADIADGALARAKTWPFAGIACVSFYQFLGDRVGIPGPKMPLLPILVRPVPS